MVWCLDVGLDWNHFLNVDIVSLVCCTWSRIKVELCFCIKYMLSTTYLYRNTEKTYDDAMLLSQH